MCTFYVNMSVAFFVKGLEAGGFLTCGEAAHVVTLIFEGEGYCADGVMTGAHLRGFYTALLENRVKVVDGHAKFFKKLRPGVQRSGRHSKQNKRVRIAKHASLDESSGVPSLKPGVFVRQVADDTKGKAGVAPSTIRDAGDGGYALKVIKEGEKICPYKGKRLHSRAEIIEASKTSNYVLDYDGVAIDSKDAGVCTSRFFNDALDKLLWNCTFKVIDGEIWVVATRRIEKWEELLLPYGWEYWWKRRLNIGKAMLGMAARAYPEISVLMNAGHTRLTKKEKVRNRWIKDNAPNAPATAAEERRAAEAAMWKCFPEPAEPLTALMYGSHLKRGGNRKEKTVKKKGLITKGTTSQWTRCKTALRDTYLDMEDVVDTNAGMRLGQGGHDIKTCGWNMSGYDDDKAETFALYMIHNDIDVGFLTDIRKTTDECEHAKRKLKNCFPEDTHISYAAVVDPGSTNGKVGGQLVIIRGAWRTAVTNVTVDPAGLGGVMVVYLKTKHQTLAIANTYWFGEDTSRKRKLKLLAQQIQEMDEECKYARRTY
jgi:hypothetical protein